MSRRVTPPRGFTLIELLVVIAIIAILSAIILASLNSARERGREASIRSTLKSMSNQIELMRADNSDYNFVNNCSTDASLKKFVDSMVAEGATVSCYSYNGDAYVRWGVSAEIVGATDLTAWSASPEGVVKWDTADIPGTSLALTDATTACSNLNKRLPSAEQLHSLWQITATGHFLPTRYWDNTVVPGDYTYAVSMSDGSFLKHGTSSGSYHVRCVQ